VSLAVAPWILLILWLARRPVGWIALVAVPAEIILSRSVAWRVLIIPCPITGLLARLVSDRILTLSRTR
jgi:hypothetical protein